MKLDGICKESFNNKFAVKRLDYFNDSVAVYVKDATDEEIDGFVEKLKLAYNENISKDSLAIITNGTISITQIVKPYIAPTLIAFALILAYMAIRYKDKGLIKSVLFPSLIVVTVGLLYFNIIALLRIPVNIYTMPISMIIFLITIIIVTYRLEKE